MSAKREEVPLGCNLGKAPPIYTECRRTQSLPNLTVAARSERRYRLPLGIRPYLCPLNFDDHIFRPAAGLEQDGPVRNAGRDQEVRIPAPLLPVDGIVAVQVEPADELHKGA